MFGGTHGGGAGCWVFPHACWLISKCRLLHWLFLQTSSPCSICSMHGLPIQEHATISKFKPVFLFTIHNLNYRLPGQPHMFMRTKATTCGDYSNKQASLLQKPLAQRQMTPCHTVWAWASQMWALAILAPRALTFPPKYFFDGERTSMSVCEPTCVLPQKA